jgi:hypothetical protein
MCSLREPCRRAVVHSHERERRETSYEGLREGGGKERERRKREGERERERRERKSRERGERVEKTLKGLI